MIKIKRTNEPPYLKARATGWLADLRAARAKKDWIAYGKVEAKYRSTPVKNALDAMFSGKCAYCEIVITVVAPGHIEHFRPKQKYPSLTFAWSNLLLGCPTCNDTGHKGAKFPKIKDNGPFIDPTLEDPADHIAFVYDISSKLAIAKAKTDRGQLMIETMGLNKRPDLLHNRSQYIRTLLAIKPDERTNPEYASILAEARGGRNPYHAWIRALGL